MKIMETAFEPITIETTVKAPVEKVWEMFNAPEHITKWNAASDDWHSPYSENDLREGGKFRTTMAAKNGSFSFDFEGVYSKVEEFRKIEYGMADGRKVQVTFLPEEGGTKIIETFDAEKSNPIEMQREGWQSILNNFKKHVESH